VVTVSRPEDMAAAVERVRGAGLEVHVDEPARRITAPAEGLGDITRIAALFDGSGIDLDDLGLQRPSLDDVFLHLTGHRAEEPDPADGTDEAVQEARA
jgi:ABC-2 type transport system ATP-binding protein